MMKREIFLSLSVLLTGCLNDNTSQPDYENQLRKMRFCIDSLPDNTPSGDLPYLAGTMNSWNGGDDSSDLQNKPPMPLVRGDAACPYFIDVNFNRVGDVHQFKFTRGSWDSEELDDEGYTIHTRRVTYEGQSKTLHFSVKKWKDLEGGAKPKPSTQVGIVETHVFPTPQLTTASRTIRVYLPEGYQDSNKLYPVLYMFDGQKLFDETTSEFGMEWQIDESMQRLIREGRAKGSIVVGIDSPNLWDDTDSDSDFSKNKNTARYREYTAWDWTLPGEGEIKSLGDKTSDFIANQVMPYIENNYRVDTSRENTSLSGSSMGGYMTLYVGTRLKEKIFNLMAFSPVAQDDPMRGYMLRDYLIQQADPDIYPQRIYMDMGGQERLGYAPEPEMLIDGMQKLCESVKTAGHKDITCKVISGGLHDEISWSHRFAEVYMATVGK
ncbi:alpha/beta hydrolase [Aeromonas veronii]